MKQTSKFFALLLLACSLLGATGAGAQTWSIGYCGTSNTCEGTGNVTATLSSGVLTINGTGDMRVFSSTNAPWYANDRTAITSVVIGAGVTSIGTYAFNGCTALTSVTILGSVTAVGSYAFNDCAALTSITLGSGVATIGTGAFNGCTGLASIQSVRLTPPEIQGNTFGSVPSTCCLYVPQQAVAAYQSNASWSSYFSCIQPLASVLYYTVSFDTQQGSEAPAEQLVFSGESATLPAADPTRENFVFGGWYTATSGGTQWDFANAVTGNLTLFARWIPMHTVTFDTQGGSAAPAMRYVTPGQATARPTNPTYTGYVFDAWYTVTVGGTPWDFATPITYSLTLYARWIRQHVVTFNTLGGSALGVQYVTPGRPAAAPTATPTRVGYAFGGWHSDDECTIPWSFTTVLTGDITLYAKWAQAFTVTFNSTGGSGVAAQNANVGDKLTKPTDPTRPDYTFGGWYTAEGDKWSFVNDVVTANVTLQARWLCTVIFNPNGGSAVARQLVPVGSMLLKPTDPRHKNYSFTMWYSDLCLATPWDFDTDTVTGDMVMYAGWAPKND